MSDYWSSRQESMYRAGEMKVNQYFSKLEKAFNQTRRELQKTVESFYWRYAEENGLTFAAAQKQLDKAEVGELKDFIDLVMQNIGRYNQSVNNMSIKARITRYQALEAQVDALLRQLYAIDYQAAAEQTMQEVYEDTYYQTWYNIDQYRGFHSSFAQVDPKAVETLLEYPFNGANFSTRIWKQKDHLQTVLTESLTTMMVQGVPPQNLAADFAKKMQSKKFEAYRLLHTESSSLMSEATHAGYKEDGVEKYEILATLDSKTCGICGNLDGEIFLVEEAVTGKNMPPFHCFCRCTDVPHYDDDDLSDQTRAARDPETGKTYEVPADMSFTEWKKAFADGGKSGLKEVISDKADERSIENPIAKKSASGIMESGSVRGALTDKNDPLYLKRDEHAKRYYSSMKNSKKDNIVKTISENTGLSERAVSKVYDHVLINEYDLYSGRKNFDPDYDMSESFRRLREGKNIQEHDLIMLKHERLEYGLMNKLGLSYEEAHELTQKKYDYQKALNEFKKKNGL